MPAAPSTQLPVASSAIYVPSAQLPAAPPTGSPTAPNAQFSALFNLFINKKIKECVFKGEVDALTKVDESDDFVKSLLNGLKQTTDLLNSHTYSELAKTIGEAFK